MKKGFSLVELAITMLISSVVYIGFIKLTFEMMNSRNQDITSKRIEIINTALGRYVSRYGHLPCPAARNAVIDTLDYGTATNCAVSAPIGTFDTGVGNAEIRIGALPFKALGLNSKFARDGWKNRFSYVVIKNLATTNTSFSSYLTSGVSALVIKDQNSNIISGAGDVAYVLISHGEKGIGAYNIDGRVIQACNAATLEGLNCTDSNIFRQSTYIENPSQLYDDLITWKTRAELIMENNLAIALQ